MFSHVSEKILCAFCKLERRVYFKKSINWTNGLIASAAALLFMYIVWQKIDPRAVIFFVIFLVVAEVFIRLRWRMALPCPHCGFDPLLYKTDRDEAVRRVRSKLDAVRASGRHLFKTQNPLENLPVIHKNSQKENRRIADENRILSKRI